MARRLKLLTSLSTVALAISGCSAERDNATAAAPAEPAAPAHHDRSEDSLPTPVGGESEGAALVNVANDKSAYLSGLQIVRGHLRAGVELYTAGDRILGPQHLRHPQAEILTSLAPAFAVYGADGVVPAIDALAAAGESGAPPADLGEKDAAALAAIGAAIARIDASLPEELLAAARTLTVAGDEYAVGVKDGAVVNLHEYHDAYGFIATAIGDLSALKGVNEAETQAIAIALEQARIAATAAPSIVPPANGLAAASVIYGAAARIEIAARGL